MLFGNQNRFAIELQPLAPSWRRKSASDRGPWGNFSLWVSGVCLTENIPDGSKQVEGGVNISLIPIADWLVRNAAYIAHEESSRAFPTDVNLPKALERWKETGHTRGYGVEEWDDERYEWVSRHFVAAADHGAWLPNVALARSEEALWLSWAEPARTTPGAPRFLNGNGMRAVPWREARETLTAFVDYVGAQLSESQQRAAFPWCEQGNAFAHATEMSWDLFLDRIAPMRRQELLDLFSVERVSQLLEHLGLPSDSSPDDSVAAKVLRDVEPSAGLREPLIRCEVDTRQGRADILPRLRDHLRVEPPGATPEEQGYRAADALREWLEIGTQPLNGLLNESNDRLGIQVEHSELKSLSNDCLAGARVQGTGLVITLSSPRTEKPWARRMEQLRGIGHLLLDGAGPKGAIGAGSSKRASGPRHRRSGAFAAEMLLPREAMVHATGGSPERATNSDVFQELLSTFGVGARTAAWQLWNAGLLENREMVEELIERHGSATPQ